MPTPSSPQPQASAPGTHRALLHDLARLLIFCMVLQVLSLPAQRAMGRAHLHGAADALHGHEHGNGRAHARLFRHQHEARDTAVVYLAEDDHHGPAGPAQAPQRSAHDIDQVLQPALPRPAGAVRQQWLAALPPAFSSHITAPPWRPPQG